MTEQMTADQREQLDALASKLGAVVPDGLDSTGADRLIDELRERADRGAQTYTSE